MKHNGTMIDVCPKCGGVWFDKGEIETMLKGSKGLKGISTSSSHDSIWISILDGASCSLPDLIEVIFDGLFDGI
jgi:hypothetical protein